MLLFDAGKEPKAEEEFNAIAADFERMMTIYEKQVRAKRMEACNAYLYAGRVASQHGSSEGTKHAYDNVLRLNNGDVDAYKLIGKQYLAVGNKEAALAEYGKIATHAQSIGNKALEDEAYRKHPVRTAGSRGHAARAASVLRQFQGSNSAIRLAG